MISRGIMSGITGSSLGDLIIIDDVIKNSEWANSETIREKQWLEWQDSILKRIHPGAIVIIIMTRWHEDDLLGRLLNPEHGKPMPWNYINLPIECDEYHINKEGNPLNRKLGEPLWADMYGKEEIEKRKQYTRSFNCMDMGRPTAAEGNMIKREWFETDESWYVQTPEFLNSIPNVCMSVDATFKNTSKSDKVAIGVWGKNGNTFYPIEEVNARMDFLATLEAIRNLKAQYPQIGMIFIEDKANGSAIINVLSNELMGVIPVNPLGGKEARLQSVLPYLVKNVKLPRNKAFVKPMIEEWYSFPNGAHDDSVDEMTQALSQMIFYYGEVETDGAKSVKDMFFGVDKTQDTDMVGDIY
jgi:predicted phage terminase large subunit-like protein